MSVFDAQRFLARMSKRSKGPAEKRRLARRLADRQRRRGAEVPAQPATVPAPPAPKSPQEIKTIRVTRHAKRVRRRVRERQRLAARSGLPELMRRGPTPLRAVEQERRARQRQRSQPGGQQAPSAPCSEEGFPVNPGAPGTAAEPCELHNSRRKTPLRQNKDSP